MRYYRIELSRPNGQPVAFSSLAGFGQPGVITSLKPDGKTTNPGALNVEFDIAQYNGHQGGDVNSYVRIWGLSLQIKQLQHWGNFRQPTADAWNTTIWASPV